MLTEVTSKSHAPTLTFNAVIYTSMKGDSFYMTKFSNLCFVLSMFATVAIAAVENPKAICTKGELPKNLQGKYLDRTTDGGTVIELQADRYFFPALKGHFEIKSCVVQRFRIVTLTDPSNPKEIQNAVVTSSTETGDLLFHGLGSNVPTLKFPNRLVDILRSPSAESEVLILERVEK